MPNQNSALKNDLIQEEKVKDCLPTIIASTSSNPIADIIRRRIGLVGLNVISEIYYSNPLVKTISAQMDLTSIVDTVFQLSYGEITEIFVWCLFWTVGVPNMVKHQYGSDEEYSALTSVFKCLICIGTTADARMCPNCSKLFCFGCIRRWITQIKTECPHCRSYLALDNLINCRFANDVVQQLDSLKVDVKTSCSLGNADICEAHHERLTVFCSTCDHAICHKCALFDGRHGDHNFRPLDEVYKEHLEIVKNEMEALSNRRREIQALLKEIVRNTNTLNLKKENRVEEIKSYFEILLFRLESTHRKKLSALNAHHGHLRQASKSPDLTSIQNEDEEYSILDQYPAHNLLVLKKRSLLNVKFSTSVNRIRSLIAVYLANFLVLDRLEKGAGYIYRFPIEEELLTSLVNEVESQLKVISPSSLINRSSALSAMFSEVHNTPMPRLNVDPNTYDLPRYLLAFIYLKLTHSTYDYLSLLCDDHYLFQPRYNCMVEDIWMREELLSSLNFSELSPQLSTGEFVIENFNRVRQQVEPLYSPPLERDGIVWRLKVYPNGNGAVRGEYLSVFLEMTTGRSEASTYEYSIQLVHQGPPPVSAKCITREFASDFAVGECWGYNRFIQVHLLEAEDYISRTNDTLRFKYMVRPHSYEVQCRDLRWRVEQLEQEKLQLKEKAKELESSSSNSCNNKGLSSPPSASVRAGDNVDLSSDTDEHDNDIDDETIPSFNSDRSPEASPDNGSLTCCNAGLQLWPRSYAAYALNLAVSHNSFYSSQLQPLGDSPGEVGSKSKRCSLPKPLAQVPQSSNSQADHANDQVIVEGNRNPPLIDSFESDDNEVNDIDISSSSTSTDGLRIESYFIEDYEEGEGEEDAEFSPHDGEEDEEDSEGFSPLITQRNGSNSLDEYSSDPIISNTGQITRQPFRRVTSFDHQRWEYLNQDINQRPSLRGHENGLVDTQGVRQSNESFYDLLRRLQDRRQVRSRGSFLSDRFEYLFTDLQDAEPLLVDRRRNQRRRPTSASYLPQSSAFRPRSSNERIMGRLETDLFQSISSPPSNGEPMTNRSSPMDMHVILSPVSSLSANTRMNLDVIGRRMLELAKQKYLNMPSTAEIERELLQQSLSSVNEMTSASLQADADESNG
ncbi:unnamed protein product [Rodentolepis nana]|uniref:RING-type domain-containing protein n=1 Tax=Rodentolepis nana TaxID=102285 RepID=A0A0R3T0V2_RODNA|nr:unnamed protein product [Rodentolepis nana]